MVTSIRRPLAAIVALSLFSSAHAQLGDTPGEGPQVPLPAARKIEPVPVLTPAEEQASFQIVRGFKIELVAAEPMVHDPVAAAYDPEGNLWVVEMSRFNIGLEKDFPALAGGATTEPDGKVVKLVSTHRDGHYDQRIEWLTGLNAPRTLRIVKDGVIIGDPPNLWLARDVHGSGKCDDKVLLLSDYGAPGGEEGSANGLLWGRDNVLHNISFEYDYLYRNGAISQRLPVLVRGQFGQSQDDFGRLFFTRNSDQLRCDEYAPRYNVRNPNVTEFPWANVRVPLSQEVWPIHPTPAVNRGYRPGILGQQTGGLRPDGTLLEFTAACSSQVYRGTNFPAQFYGNVFVPEPSANLIKRDILLESQGQITAVNAYEGREFLASTDSRFRPVALVNAPDGSLLVADMYRGILEEYHMITSYLRDQTISRGLTRDLYGHGRLWRISYDRGSLGSPAPDLDAKSTVDLVALLADRDSWWRDTAQQMLVERGDRAAVPALEEAASESEDPATRVCALWTLDGLGATSLDFLGKELKDPSPKVRSAAIRLHERWLGGPDSAAALHQLSALVEDPEPEVVVQLALSVGEAKSDEADSFLVRILAENGEHPFIPAAIATGLRGREFNFFQKIALALPQWGQRPEVAAMIRVLSSAIVHQADPKQVPTFLAQIGDGGGLPHWARVAAIAGMQSLEKPAFRRTIGTTRLMHAAALTDLAASSDPEVKEAITKLQGRLQQAEAEVRLRAMGRPLTSAERPLYDEGKTTYQICSACHQATGEGQVNVAPSLVDSHWVVSNPGLLVRILLSGKEGTPGFPSAMPAVGMAFSDQQIAGVLTYIRNSWGLQSGAVSPALVTQLRAKYGKRTAPWTDAELGRAELHPLALEQASESK